MKKVISIILTICISLSIFSHQVPNVMASSVAWAADNTYTSTNEFAPGPSFDYEFLPASDHWLSLVAGVLPATFSEDNISYTLAPNVVLANQTVINSIASADQLISGSSMQLLRPNRIIEGGGYIPISVLNTVATQQGTQITNGTVVVDEVSGTAFKVVSPTIFDGVYQSDPELQELVKPFENTYSITTPALHEVITDFTLEEETITLTRGNISGFAPNIEKNFVMASQLTKLSINDSENSFKHLSNDPMISIQFENEKLEAKVGDNTNINVIVSGGLGIDGIDLTGEYSCFGGYEIGMTLEQESYLTVELEASIQEEIRIPILGLDIPFGVGRIYGGLFVIVGLDGSISLEIVAREFTSVSMGIEGGTSFYIPTSFHPYFHPTLETDGDVDLSGKINGTIKFGPLVSMELFGMDLVGAGVVLGAGVTVETNGKSLNVDLYGIFNVYLKLFGKHFTLINYQPTIFKRQQADTAGYKIKIVEAFINPGLVGGMIQRRTGGEDIPVPGVEYRIIVIPETVAYDMVDPAKSFIDPLVRKYPSTGYASTNNEGEFLQKSSTMLYQGDRVILEFKKEGISYYSDIVTPILPFEQITITQSDYFNDFVTGQVAPIKTIDWEATDTIPGEKPYKLTYCNKGHIYVNPFLSSGIIGNQYFGQTLTQTDEKGNFDTRNPFVTPEGNTVSGMIDIRPSGEQGMRGELSVYYTVPLTTMLNVTLEYNNATLLLTMTHKPTMQLDTIRMLDEIEGSYTQFQEGDKLIDQMIYDESIWIVNPLGTRTITEDEFDYAIWGFSTQDYHYRGDDSYIENAVSAYTGDNKWSTAPFVQPQTTTKSLTPILDEYGQPTGTALFTQRVTVEWVWQSHPNPVTITSEDHTEVTTKGGTFQVTTTGFYPFTYSLYNAPEGVTINKNSGLMTLPEDLPVADYTFTVHVAEADLQIVPILTMEGADPRRGNAPSPPDEQLFTLTVSQDTTPTDPPPQSPEPSSPPETTETPEPSSSPETTETPKPSSPPETTETPKPSSPPETTMTPKPSSPPETAPPIILTAPVIAEEEHGYQFKKLQSGSDLVIQINASGSTPMTYSLVSTNPRQPVPTGLSIDANTGEITIKKGISTGQYLFTIQVSNDVGTDSQDCSLNVISLSMSMKPDTPIIIPKPSPSAKTSPNIAFLSTTQQTGTRVSLPIVDPISSDAVTTNSNAIGFNTTNSNVPLNSISIRCDHSADVFTNNRLIINGAAYIRWDTDITITVEGKSNLLQIIDKSPVCEQYHYVDPIYWDADDLNKIKNSFKEMLTTNLFDETFFGDGLDKEGLMEDFNNYRVNPISIGYLEYGSLIDSMNQQNGGSFNVDLNSHTGTMVAGDYFVGLQNNQKATLVFSQAGAVISFAGNDIASASEYDLFNFAYSDQAFHETEMLDAIGPGGQSFTFGFAHHGELPGIATFSISAGLTEGTQVNVYKYNAETTHFSQVASNLIVEPGGIVTYKNNTMSEYIITTNILPNAIILDMVNLQGEGQSSQDMIWLLSLGIVALLAAVVIGLYLRKKKLPR